MNQILDLPYYDGMQDWAIELADAARVSLFCDLYETGNLNANEKFALMQLIVASMDDLLNDLATKDTETVLRVLSLLWQDFVLHFFTVEYWSELEKPDPTMVFAATPYLRIIWHDCFQPDYASWIETNDE